MVIERGQTLNSCFGLSLPVNERKALKAGVSEVTEKEHCLQCMKANPGTQMIYSFHASKCRTMPVI